MKDARQAITQCNKALNQLRRLHYDQPRHAISNSDIQELLCISTEFTEYVNMIIAISLEDK